MKIWRDLGPKIESKIDVARHKEREGELGIR